MATFPIKQLPDGRALLNLGCGTKMDWRWVNVDFSPYTRLVRRRRISSLLHRAGVLSDERYEKLRLVDPDIIHWDLSRGIPFPDERFDVVYHSHVLEHLPREMGHDFIVECFRVLRPSGVLRVVVPDLRQITEWYRRAFSRAEAGDLKAFAEYDYVVDKLFGQMVRTTSVGTSRQRPIVRRAEQLLRGGPARMGELHQWMYDRVSVRRLLHQAGFRDIEEHSYQSSRIAEWSCFELDQTADGSPHKMVSLYVEGIKPSATG